MYNKKLQISNINKINLNVLYHIYLKEIYDYVDLLKSIIFCNLLYITIKKRLLYFL